MRILMVLDQPFPPDMRVENEARSLVEAGFEVGVLVVSPDTRPEEETYRGLRLFRDRLPKQARDKMKGLLSRIPLYTFYLDWRIRQVYRRFPFDALHVHDLYLFGAGLRAGRKLGVPVVGDLHENYVEALKHYAWSTRIPGKWFVSIPRWERMERAWVRAVDRLVVVIEEAAARNEALGVPPDRITVVPNTINLDEFEGYTVDTGLAESLQSELTLVYTGGVDAHRGLDTVVEAMPDVLDAVPGALLVIVGDGRTRAELEARAAALGVGDRVRFEGWQPPDRLVSYMAAADLCLVPHHRTAHTDATIPHKLFHYMYMERPVVVSDCRPLKRIVEATRTGRVFEAGNPADFVRVVTELAALPGARRAMGERGLPAVREAYNWDVTVRGLITLYRSLASDEVPPSG